jgi:hypothetical protein
MRKLTRSLTVIGVIFLMAQPIIAQPTITLEVFGGWLWTGKAGQNNNIKVDDKGNYGVRAGVSPSSEILVEFEWNHTDTRLSWYDVLTNTNEEEDVAMNYYMIGINKHMAEGPAVPYGLLNLGVLNVKGQTLNFSENWFTVGLGGGLKYYMSDRIGIRLQARLLLPMQFAGIGFGCGGGGCSSGVSAYTSTIQGDFTGGVILRLGG